MTRNEIAVHSFSLLTEIAEILHRCHANGSGLTYKISKKGTHGYEVSIGVADEIGPHDKSCVCQKCSQADFDAQQPTPLLARTCQAILADMEGG